jgi:hypothetical protein
LFSSSVSANKDNLMLDFFLEEVGPNLIKTGQQDSDSGVQGGSIASLFEIINANLSSELVAKTNAMFHFIVKG